MGKGGTVLGLEPWGKAAREVLDLAEEAFWRNPALAA